MNIKSHTALVLAICTATGISLGLGVVLGYRGLEMQIQQVGPNSLALRDASRLRSLLGQWLLSADLVLGSDEAHMLNASMRQAKELVPLIGAIRSSALASDQQDELRSIEFDILRLRELVETSRGLRGTDREQRLKELVTNTDTIATPLARRVESLQGRMRQRSVYMAQELEEQRNRLQLLSWLAAGFYCMVGGMCWLWTTRSMVRPIESLSLAAERTQLDDSFALAEQGPDEVRRLTRNISTFATKLQTAQETTEAEVQRRTDQLVKANNAKSEFLATMSHELRTPLNGIINMNELILGTELDGEQTECARTAKNAAEALLSLINDILDFSKLEARKLELDLVPLNLRDVVDGATDIMSGVAEAKHIELGCVIARDVPFKIIGDSMRLRQVLINLLNNAVKFTEAGQVLVRVSRGEHGDESDLLRFEVEDTGIGIPKHRQPLLFNAFQQVDSSTTRNFGGTGLGLAISKELAQLMGGEIGVDSEPGRGSTFWFTVRTGRVEHTEGIALPPDERDRSVVVVSGRAFVAQRLNEQLALLGIEDRRIVHMNEVSDRMRLPDVAKSSGETLVILDPYGKAVDATDTLRTLRAMAPLADARFCVLKEPLRTDDEAARQISGVARLLAPTKPDRIREWILADAGDEPIIIEDLEPSESTIDRSEVTILVAEDNPINQRVAAKVLENAGFRVELVSNGELAVALLRSRPCDLVLMDCQMPTMDGWQATRAIRELEADGALAAGCASPMPIIALTANALAGDREKCLEAGMNDYIAKPFKPKELVAAIAGLLPVAGQAS